MSQSNPHERIQAIWRLNKEHIISADKLQRNQRIAWCVKKWGNMLYKAQIADLQPLENGKVRIKAGESNYTYWVCSWHIVDSSDTIYLLGQK